VICWHLLHNFDQLGQLLGYTPISFRLSLFVPSSGPNPRALPTVTNAGLTSTFAVAARGILDCCAFAAVVAPLCDAADVATSLGTLRRVGTSRTNRIALWQHDPPDWPGPFRLRPAASYRSDQPGTTACPVSTLAQGLAGP
jgi:hypothetical protein